MGRLDWTAVLRLTTVLLNAGKSTLLSLTYYILYHVSIVIYIVNNLRVHGVVSKVRVNIEKLFFCIVSGLGVWALVVFDSHNTRALVTNFEIRASHEYVMLSKYLLYLYVLH